MRVADVHLRGRSGPLAARAYCPQATDEAPALLMFFDDSLAGADPLCRGICERAGVVVLAASCADADEATTVLEWAAHHAAELGADPARLLVVGEGHGADLAVAVARRAQDSGWPVIARLVLVEPGEDRDDD